VPADEHVEGGGVQGITGCSLVVVTRCVVVLLHTRLAPPLVRRGGGGGFLLLAPVDADEEALAEEELCPCLMRNVSNSRLRL
jgi:hypothetical protein